MTATKELTTAEFATALGTDPRTVRKYLRSVTPRDEQPGKGSRWALPGTKTAISKHQKGFATWVAAQAEAAAERAAKAQKDAEALVEELTDEVEDSIEDLEPSDEDLVEVDED